MTDWQNTLDIKDMWTSDAHQAVAETLLCGNSAVYTRDALMEAVDRINGIPSDKIKSIKFADLPGLGLGWLMGRGAGI
jgi:hypothetical protein